MAHGHGADTPTTKTITTTKCDHIDCECLTHLSDSSEHVICKWDPSIQVMGQYSPGTASCIRGVRLSTTEAAGAPPNSRMESARDVGRFTGNKDANGRVHFSPREKVGFSSSSEEDDDLNRLKSELSETQALLEKTEEQLLQQMDRNQDIRETSQSGTTPSLASYRDSLYFSSLQDVIGHLYLGKDDAKRLLETVKSRLQQDVGTDTSQSNFLLRTQLWELQSVLEDIIKGREQQRESDTNEHPKPEESDQGRRNINIVETLMQKLNDKEDELRRWEVLVEQLNKELEQARLRCESNTNALYSKQEECRQRETELHNAGVKMHQLERLLSDVRSKGRAQGQTRTTQTDSPPHPSHPSKPGDALSELTARLHQQQMAANELHLEREHNQRLQELRLGVVEAGNHWEKEVMTLDMQVKQLTQQLKDAQQHVMLVGEEKRHQRKHLQDMKESLKQVDKNREEISAELAEVKGQMSRSNQQLTAAHTALTYERSNNEKLKELNSAASKTELQLTEELKELKEIERRLSAQLSEAQRGSSELRKQCQALCSDLEQANQELQERADTISRLETEMESTMTASKDEIKAERETARSVRAELEKALQAGQDEIDALKTVMKQQDEDLQVLKETRKELERQNSDNARLKETNMKLQLEVERLQAAIEEQRDEDRAIQKQSESVKRDLEVALVRQKSYKEWGMLNERKIDNAQRNWEDERTQLTNCVTELQVTLKETKNSLEGMTSSKQEISAAKEHLQQRCEALQQQVHVKDVSLQTTLERLSNTQKQLQEERRAKNEFDTNLKMLRSTLDKKEASLQSQMNRMGNLDTQKANLKAMIQTQKASIETLQKQLNIQQVEFVNYKTQTETKHGQYEEENEKTISDLQQQIKHLQEITNQSQQKDNSLTADLEMLSKALMEKRADHSKLLQTLHDAEQKEKELKEAQQQLTFELQTEKESQCILRQRLEKQEEKNKELCESLSQLKQQDDSLTDKSFNLENLKESLDSSFRLELNHLKAEITRQATVKESHSKKMSDHDKVLILQRELGKLRTLHLTDQSTIGSLTEDVAILRTRLAKQKALILNNSSRVRKSDVQAALAKAQAKAFVTMSPINRRQQQVMNFDPTGHLYGIPQSTFDDFTLRGFGSDKATYTGSTDFSAGNSDCDYSS